MGDPPHAIVPTPPDPRPGVLVVRALAPAAAARVPLLTVAGAPPEFLACDQPEPERQRCMEEGADGFRTLWSDRIH